MGLTVFKVTGLLGKRSQVMVEACQFPDLSFGSVFKAYMARRLWCLANQRELGYGKDQASRMLHSQWGQRLQVIGKSKAVLAQVRESDSHKSIFDLGSYSSPCKLPGFLLRTWAWKCPVGSPCIEDFWPIDHHAS